MSPINEKLPLESDDLRAGLERRIDGDAALWLHETEARVEADPDAIGAVFPAVGRKVGRGTFDPAADPADVHAWTVDDAARTLLLLALGDGATIMRQLPDLYRFGDTADRRGLLRALAYLDIGDAAIGIVDDAVRGNDTFLIAAALGPYATVQLDTPAWEHAVLKCVFSGVPISPLHGLLARRTANGSRMLAGLVHERVAAGRDVPAEVWIVIDAYPPADEIAAIEAEAESSFDDRREAARKTLADRKTVASSPPPAGR